MEKMLVQEALNKVKLLDKKIDKTINTARFVVASKKSEENALPGLSKKEFEKRALAEYDSISDLIKNRNKIKAAIIKSNAEIIVEINGDKMTVAEAIERKSSIQNEISLLQSLKLQRVDAFNKCENSNARMDKQIDIIYEQMSGNKDKKSDGGQSYESIASAYKSLNEFGLVDPLNSEKKIMELEESIDKFLSEVDSVLQISNCSTIIEVDI